MKVLNLQIESCYDCPFKMYYEGELYCLHADSFINPPHGGGIDYKVCLLPSDEEE